MDRILHAKDRSKRAKIIEHGSADEVILDPKSYNTKRLISDVPKIYEKWDLSTV